jgi:hypothetical protein
MTQEELRSLVLGHGGSQETCSGLILRESLQNSFVNPALSNPIRQSF